ncbi:hypothetical protein BGW80DRAFT_1456703 [Lactifluus volemus]|nr:hypothetical protein BGW80DRAFT_1456703 [Lactifluus volemus]
MSQRRTCFYLTLESSASHLSDMRRFGPLQRCRTILARASTLRRLDLGTCPWELVRGLFPELTGLRVLRVRIASLTNLALGALVRALPEKACDSSACTHEYAPAFAGFGELSMLHLHGASIRRPQPPRMHDRELQLQRTRGLRTRATLRSPCKHQYLSWHDEHFVVVRHHYDSTISAAQQFSCVRRYDESWYDLGSDDAMWVERKDVPIDYEMSSLVS